MFEGRIQDVKLILEIEQIKKMKIKMKLELQITVRK